MRGTKKDEERVEHMSGSSQVARVFFFFCEQCECRRMSNSVEWNTGTYISRILMRRIILKMHRDVFVPTKTTKCVIPSWYYNINAYIVFTFTYLWAEILESEPAKRFTCASHFSAFYIHPRCEDDSSQLWQREDNVLQLPERTAVGFIWAGCSFYSEARSIISWRKPGIPAPLHHIRAILIPISITLHVTSFMSPCCELNSKL